MIDKEQIIANLREVFDPEISINIYDLGLIYDIKINQEDFWVEITHTLTSDITGAGYAPEVLNVEVITTFDPPFTMDSVSEETKMIMGW